MRIVFWGTPETALPFLEFLYKQVQVLAVVTQTDKAAKRGQKIQKSPVKQFAEEKQIPVLQPADLKNSHFLTELSDLKPEAGIVVAYGKILPKEVIWIFPKGIFNIHFSLLPHLRGAAPIQWAILRGDKKTGVTCFKISETLDTGNMVAQKEIEILPSDNAVTLEERLILLGIQTLQETLLALKNGTLSEKPQIGESSYAPLIKRENAKIDWNKPAEEIARQVRALVKIGAFTCLPSNKILKILKAEPSPSPSSSPLKGEEIQPSSSPPAGEGWGEGKICGIEKGQGFFVKCKIGTVLVTKVQLEGKKEMDAWSFLQGSRLKIGEQLN